MVMNSHWKAYLHHVVLKMSLPMFHLEGLSSHLRNGALSTEFPISYKRFTLCACTKIFIGRCHRYEIIISCRLLPTMNPRWTICFTKVFQCLLLFFLDFLWLLRTHWIFQIHTDMLRGPLAPHKFMLFTRSGEWSKYHQAWLVQITTEVESSHGRIFPT